jgi:hypothetical protein
MESALAHVAVRFFMLETRLTHDAFANLCRETQLCSAALAQGDKKWPLAQNTVANLCHLRPLCRV